jgi:nucleoporin NUP159
MGFGPKRLPAYQFIVRLRDYKPNFKDVLIVASTASSEIGLIIRSEKQLEEGVPPGTFALAGLTDDTKRASVPLADTQDDTSVIGLAANLSSSENVSQPIPEEEFPESATPLPGLLLLNNEGILASWWFIYTEAIRQNIPYSGLVSATQPSQMSSQPVPAPPASAPAQQQPSFGQPSFGSPSQFGTSGFAKPSGGSTFGSPSTMGATAFGKPSFGSPSGLGGSAAPAFGKPSFGTGTAFGQSSSLGQPAFGQSGFSAASTSSPFGQPSTPGKSLLGSGSGTSGGGFSSFSTGAGGGGFAGFAAAKPGESPFAKASGDNAFAKASAPSPFGAKPSSDTAFPPAQTQEVKNPFGSAGGFVLGSSFKGDGTAVNDLPTTEKPSSGALSFGGFGESISLSNKPSTPAESMDDSEDTTAPQPVEPEPVSLFGRPSKPAVPAPSLFGAQTTQPAKAPPLETTKPFSIFGTAPSAAPQSPFQASSQTQVTSPLSAPSDVTATPKREPSVTTPTFSSLEAPLPPDPTHLETHRPPRTSLKALLRMLLSRRTLSLRRSRLSNLMTRLFRPTLLPRRRLCQR